MSNFSSALENEFSPGVPRWSCKQTNRTNPKCQEFENYKFWPYLKPTWENRPYQSSTLDLSSSLLLSKSRLCLWLSAAHTIPQCVSEVSNPCLSASISYVTTHCFSFPSLTVGKAYCYVSSCVSQKLDRKY